MAGVDPLTTLPVSKEKRPKSKRAQTESIDSMSVTKMAAVSNLTINEWMKELDEFR